MLFMIDGSAVEYYSMGSAPPSGSRVLARELRSSMAASGDTAATDSMRYYRSLCADGAIFVFAIFRRGVSKTTRIPGFSSVFSFYAADDTLPTPRLSPCVLRRARSTCRRDRLTCKGR